jgi:ubiquinone/menaquinone biosynthesis C-methylase UbiE
VIKPAERKRYASRRFARRFDRLRRYQHSRRSVVRRIGELRRVEGARVVELGAGTGVLTQEICREAPRWVAAFDRAPRMIELARENLQRRGHHACSFARADHRHVPLRSGCADLVVAAWALDSVIYDSDEATWRSELDRVVGEMRRLLARGGVAMIIGSPYGGRDHVGHLERVHGFSRRLFKTVWRFPSRRIARSAVTLFFRRAVWRDYRRHWPKDLVTLAGLWWKAC